MRIWYKLTVQIGHDAHAELYVAVITTVVLPVCILKGRNTDGSPSLPHSSSTHLYLESYCLQCPKNPTQELH